MYNNELRPDTNANKIAGGVYNNGVVSNHAQAVFKTMFSTTHPGRAGVDVGFHYYSFVNLITSFSWHHPPLDGSLCTGFRYVIQALQEKINRSCGKTF